MSIARRAMAFAVGAAVGMTTQAALGARTLYVAPNGNDTWSGKLASPNARKTDGPLASITRARDAVRELKAQQGGLRGPVSVQLRGGVYYLTETITFTPQDSGTKACPIAYMAYPGEKPQLVGGRRITGFKPARGGVMSVFLPQVKEGKWHFRQLFVDDRRQIRARHPNFDPSNPHRGGFAYVDGGRNGFGLALGCLHPPGTWMEYRANIPAHGEYHVWMYYGARNKPYGTTDMAGRTTLRVDRGDPVPLMRLPDTGGFSVHKWSRNACLQLTRGERILRWENVKGGGLDLEAFALSDDPNWQPAGTDLPKPAPGRHVVLIQAEDFERSHATNMIVGLTDKKQGSKETFMYRPGDVKPSWASAPDAEVHIFPGGGCRNYVQIVSLDKVDEATHTVTVGGKERRGRLQMGDRYFVENVREALDSPGEWYLDREKGVLDYWPKRPLSSQSEVVAPVLGRVIQLRGDPASGKSVSWLRFAGLTIKNTDYSPEDGCAGSGMGNDGAVYMRAATNCTVQRCRLLNTGKTAVCITDGGSHTVTGNDISQSGEGGVVLINSAGNTVVDNHIHDCGQVYKHVAGVALVRRKAEGNRIAHNLIHDIPRYGITLKAVGSRNVIEYNELYNLSTETYDTGGIEVTQHHRTFRSHGIIRYNIVHDVVGYSSVKGVAIFLGHGIYLDSFAGGYSVNNNIVYRTRSGGIMFQGGKDNKVENNIFVDGFSGQVVVANHDSNSTGLEFVRNIVYFTNPTALFIQTGKLSRQVLHADYNVYCHVGQDEPSVVRQCRIRPLAEWRKHGFDVHSVVADPLFVDPKKDNYALRPESPAFKLGFKAIDTSRIGRLSKKRG